MSNETKFFDVERAHESTYNLKELRRLFKRILKKSNVEYRVYRMGGMVRLKVIVPRYMTMDFVALQQEHLDYRGLMLHEVAEDGTAEPVVPFVSSVLEEERAIDSPITIPVSTVITGSHKPIVVLPPYDAVGTSVEAVRSAA